MLSVRLPAGVNRVEKKELHVSLRHQARKKREGRRKKAQERKRVYDREDKEAWGRGPERM